MCCEFEFVKYSGPIDPPVKYILTNIYSNIPYDHYSQIFFCMHFCYSTVTIQTTAIENNVNAADAFYPRSIWDHWEGVYVFPLCVFRLTAVRSPPPLLSAVFNPALAGNRPDILRHRQKRGGVVGGGV